ncbi:MAG: carbohydrate-binding protein [Candidatus Hydrogenedentes bacterium]|nr:carbohydrate-binding protein [Candidatus Hydrogenedentota bacterium]
MSNRCYVTVIGLLCITACATSPTDSAGATKPYGGKSHAIPGTIEAEHFDEGGPGVAYGDIDEVNHGAAYRSVTHVDIEQRSDASNGYGVGWARATEWLIYTVDVKTSGAYEIEIPVASQKNGGIFHLELNGKDISGPIQIPDTGAWTKLETIRVNKVTLKKGTHAMKLVMDSNGDSGGIGDIDCLRFELAEK